MCVHGLVSVNAPGGWEMEREREETALCARVFMCVCVLGSDSDFGQIERHARGHTHTQFQHRRRAEPNYEGGIVNIQQDELLLEVVVV